MPHRDPLAVPRLPLSAAAGITVAAPDGTAPATRGHRDAGDDQTPATRVCATEDPMILPDGSGRAAADRRGAGRVRAGGQAGRQAGRD
ncbi:hypothetical protein IQ62_14190 [Streptomyces scabiei]|nr:hypothetical protein IQ62_14190 [Streptomyces scabiei]